MKKKSSKTASANRRRQVNAVKKATRKRLLRKSY